MEKAVDLELLQGLWKMYLRQKGEEDAVGRDIKPDVDRMRGVFNLAARGVLSDEEIDARFPETPTARIPGSCQRCHNTGMFYTREAQFKFRGAQGIPRTRTAKGMEMCDCFEGRRLREAIKKPPKTRKRGMRG